MKTAVVTINGEPHEVKELPAKTNAHWRQLFEERMGGVMSLLRGLPNQEINNTQELVNIVTDALPVIFDAIDGVVDLAIAYDDAFADAYESEISAAYPALLGLAFPFVDLARLLGRQASTNGATQTPTTTN